MFLPLLQNIWLNENESKVYLACLELGNAHAWRIIKHNWLARATVYDALERLIKKWLVNKMTRKGTTIFSPEDPERLEYILEMQSKSLKTVKKNLDSVLPQLKKLKNPYMRLPSVRIYEGIEGIRTVLNDSLTAKEIIYTYVNVDAMEKHIKQINDEYLEKRQKNIIRKKGLLVDTSFSRERMKGYDTTVTEARFLSKSTTPFHIEMNIYDGKISYLTYRDKNPLGIIIEDEDIYRIHRSTFELLWEQSEIV
ncbi:MAG: transcriptional regulator, TrmB [uncultured bacterium (gcode 4)]|uniref:Transcriptional regulator, TrmB n=1 Tax=uncultured bacterium (gcode 4) TaxID=1234023 RepID=K1Z5Z8_9BACT|nr:MAG: transcriptional regulator, TrmB [uncultured bacterium (gcode 4)]